MTGVARQAATTRTAGKGRIARKHSHRLKKTYEPKPLSDGLVRAKVNLGFDLRKVPGL
jgi:hypothetical protein